MAKDQVPPSLPRRQLGKHLRRAREAANLRQEEVAQLMQWSPSTQSRLEHGDIGRLRDRDLVELGRILELGEAEVVAMIGLLRQPPTENWWRSFMDVMLGAFDVYLSLEAEARVLDIYQPHVVPGLFQTVAYAGALDRIYFPGDCEEDQRRRVEVRLRRQRIITRKSRPVSVTLILHEAVLHTIVGSSAVMAAQLSHLAALSTLPNVTILVLPYGAGLPIGTPVGPYVILDFPDSPKELASPTTIYIENLTGDMYLGGEGEVKRYRAVSQIIRRAALDEVTSRNMLRQLSKEYQRGR
ncbi:helix-turn-helix domain-containing protein [Nocardia pseudobrasiliensis]|uniref:Transcriptional regulator with XRE-family HTH domain n=1 Tax=Nocardia pseudobrasiliensis TaxID=45979 RepID=A0A370I7I5_9NOCA|nr:helix-turn-helix transcriptional regulator [Nocardia pseudobrasiliensis]RDI66590.1 transcriptional regulator with XRE-family HTH domain [Nocardia pseudobrasiliensis]